ncbi:hypothetical protein KKA09_03210 [Patescibacteria group bacterium]|nr:hypothetical protein [Patescibacteria group bacterium]
MANQLIIPTEYIKKLENLEKELLKIKKGERLFFLKKPISLKGILKGIKISLKDIEEAKKSVFGKVEF